jgi:anti-sigma factor RsiW
MSACIEPERLGRYHDDELPDDARRAVERHLAGCPACAGELAQLRALSGRLRAGPWPRLSAPDRAELRVTMAAAAEERAEARDARPGRVARWLTTAAAVVFLVSASQVVLHQLSTRSQPGGTPAPWQGVSSEQRQPQQPDGALVPSSPRHPTTGTRRGESAPEGR